jgi:hypothetical protein
MAKVKTLTELYNSLNDKPLNEQFPEDDEYLAHMMSSDTQMTGDAFEDPHSHAPSKTYGDMSPEEWDAMRDEMGMKTDDEGNRYLDREYDPGNEPLEIQHSETGITYFINVEDIEAYVSGEEVIAVDPDRGMDAIRVTREETDVVGVSEEELEDFLVSGDRSVDDLNEQPRPDYADVDGDGDEEESMKKAFQDKEKEKMDEAHCTEEEIAEGTCGYGKNGKIGRKPAGPNLMRYKRLQERFQKLANIKK